MKKIITLVFIAAIGLTMVNAATWTVSNNPDIPAQFTQIQEAIIDANTSEGDTILVAGSPNRYGDFVLNKNFVIIGAGIHNPYGYNTWVNAIDLATKDGFTPSGSVLSGLWIDNYLEFYTSAAPKTIENVTIERCWLDTYFYMYGDAGSTYRNITFKNCMFEDSYMYFYGIGTLENIVFSNNLFDNRQINQSGNPDLSNVTFKNNVFINEGNNVFGATRNLVLQDNIFFKALPQGCTGCTFTNNTVYATVNNVLPGDDNVGSGNEARDPKFVNYTDADGEFTWAAGYDFHLLPVSEDDDSGTGGGQRGMYGGPSPIEFGSNPAIPQLTEIIFTDNASSVKEEGTLKVKFKAKKQD
jgi:hypothetical protein